MNYKLLFHLSWISSVYFMLLVVNAYLTKFDFLLLGTVMEVFTIPIMLAQLVICFLSLGYCIKNGFNTRDYPFWAFIISFLNTFLPIGSIVFGIG